ncbi:MAG: hypothetical protein WCH07_09720, partial [Deltaproteobacteria bacterium]
MGERQEEIRDVHHVKMEVIIMAFWQSVGLRHGLRARMRKGIYKSILTIFIALSFIFLGQVSFAADISGKYQVVA